MSPRCFRRAAGAGLALVALSLLPGCSRSEPPAARMAVVRFENLTGDASLDWMGRALSELLGAAAAGTPRTWVVPHSALRTWSGALGRRPAAAPGVSAERSQALLAGANRLVYGEFSISGGRLRVAAVVEDAASRKVVRSAEAAGKTPEDVPGAAAALAAELGVAAQPPATENLEALRHYAAGLDAGSRAAALRAFESATAADPGFGRAWLAAISVASPADRAAARQLAERARAFRGRMGPVERARLDLELARDAAARRSALEALIEAEPADPASYSALAALHHSEHRHADAAAVLRRAAAHHPEDAALLNNLGYAEAWAGDFDAAVAALGRYRRVRPEDPNALDSLGDVHLYFGKAAEAEGFYLDAYARNPRFQDGGPLLKAAFARLMDADMGRAGATFERYLDARRAARDPLADYRHAEWLWLTGKRRPGLEKLAAFAAAAGKRGEREPAARAHAHLAIWTLQLGDKEGARRHAAEAAALAGPASAGMAALAQFVTGTPASASEWALRAERRFESPGASGLKRFALACALLFAGEFRDAGLVLREAHARWTPAGDPAIPVLLAWAWTASGRPGDAAPLLERNPIPQGAGLNVFTSMWFPRLFALRGQVLAARGSLNDAVRHYRRFLDLSGPGETIWGDEERARTALNGR